MKLCGFSVCGGLQESLKLFGGEPTVQRCHRVEVAQVLVDQTAKLASASNIGHALLQEWNNLTAPRDVLAGAVAIGSGT
eukprot:5143097-Pleurochrysis_carterae.AAC.1